MNAAVKPSGYQGFPWFDKTFLSLLLLGCALTLSSCSKSTSKSSPKKLQIAAATSLAGAFEDVARAFTQETGIGVSLILGSSGKLREQISEGAPFDVFASANESYIRALAGAGDVQPGSVEIYARGRLVLWVNSGQAPKTLAELADPRFEHIAIANPEHAPYGTAAREALKKIKMWSSLKDHIVRGSNVRQAMQYAESGNAEVALIAYSLAIAGGGSYSLIDKTLHAPLQQAIAVVSSTQMSSEARAFIEFLRSPQGSKIVTQYGFDASSIE